MLQGCGCIWSLNRKCPFSLTWYRTKKKSQPRSPLGPSPAATHGTPKTALHFAAILRVSRTSPNEMEELIINLPGLCMPNFPLYWGRQLQLARRLLEGILFESPKPRQPLPSAPISAAQLTHIHTIHCKPTQKFQLVY